MKRLPSIQFLLFALLWGASVLAASASEVRSLEFAPAQLFAPTKIWDVHFTFEADQWAAMEPEGGTGGPFGPGGGRGGPGREGGPGGFGRPGGFGSGTFLAPAFLKAGDQDADRKLSKQEFAALGAKWFMEWDAEKTGSLTNDQLRAGLNVALKIENAGPPVGPGGPGMPGMNGRSFLQASDGRRNGLSSMMGIEFKDVRASMDFHGETFRDVAVRYKGNGTFMESRGSLKRSLKVDTNDFVKGQKLAGLTKLNFHNNVTDASYMNEVLSLRLFRDAGVPASRTAYARVYVTVPGKHDKQYFGLYSLVENVDENFARERAGSKKGAIFKPSTNRPFTDLGDNWSAYNQAYDPKTELTVTQAQRVIDFCKLVSKADDTEFVAKVGEYLDLEEFARFMAVTVYLSSLDSILGVGQNYYVYLHPESQKLQFLPWDHDHSFGQFMMGGGQPEKLSIHRPWQGENPFLERVFKVEQFKTRYLALMEEFTRTIFQPDRFHEQVDELATALRPAVQEESEEKLAAFDRVVAGETARPPAAEGRFPGRGGKPIKPFVQLRGPEIAEQLAGKVEGDSPSFGFGGRGGGGGPGGRFEPGTFNAPLFLKALDTNKDEKVDRGEWDKGFEGWFAAWDTEQAGVVTEEQLRTGITRDLPMMRPGPPPGGPTPDGPPPGVPAPAGQNPGAQPAAGN